MNGPANGPVASQTVDLPADWSVRRGMHGGVLAALLMRAAHAVTPQHRPVSLTVHYLRPASAGRGCVVTEVLRAGRSTSVRLRLVQDGLVAEGLAELSATSTHPAHPAHDDLTSAPRPAELPRLVTGLTGPVEERMELRVRTVQHDGEAHTEGWARMVHPDDAAAWGATGTLLVLADSLTPALLTGRARDYVASTVALTAHVLPTAEHEPAGWWHVVHTTVWSSPELCLEDTAVRTPTGDLALLVRQTRRLLGDHGLE